MVEWENGWMCEKGRVWHKNNWRVDMLLTRRGAVQYKIIDPQGLTVLTENKGKTKYYDYPEAAMRQADKLMEGK